MDHESRERLIDVPERRALAQPLTYREDANGEIVLEGYAATWDPYDCYGGPNRGGWVEQLQRAAFTRTLAENPDVMLLINHEGLPIARTVSGTLELSADHHGLRLRAMLDKSDPDVQRLAPKMKPQANGRSNLDEMSFSFRVKDQIWNTDHTHRTITELSLSKGDVSVVNYGMNPKTRAMMSAEAVGALARVSGKELVELRSMGREELAAAMSVLQRAWQGDMPEPKRDDSFGGKQAKPFKGKGNEKDDDRAYGNDGRGTMVNFDGSHLIHDGQCVTCAHERATTPGKYSGVAEFADPGYLDSSRKPAKGGNGVKRYPIDAKHVQAAWSYINMPKNQKGYSASQLAAIKGRIKAAMKKYGHDVSEAASLSPTDMQSLGVDAMEISHIEQVRKFGGGVTLVAVMNDGTRTPLPSFRQSGQQVGSPTGSDFYARRGTCPGGGMCPGDTCPDHGEDVELGLRGRTTDNSVGSGGAQPLMTYDWQPGVDANQIDPHQAPYTKTDAGGSDPGELQGSPAPAPSADSGSFGARAKSDDEDEEGGEGDEGEDDVDDRADANPGDTVDDIHDDEDEVDDPARSVSERLSVLRRDAELPDLPTVSEAMQYVRNLA